MSGKMLFDSLGKPVTLGPRIGKGGEAEIFEIAGEPSLLAKIYTKPDAERTEKLRSMLKLGDADLLKFAAWPKSTLHATRGDTVAGIVMPRVIGQEIHILYSPAHRKQAFPHADWSFLIHTAMNCALAFEVIHGKGHVVGDVNQRNLMVSATATVALIDCDSFQVQTKGRVYYCKYGVPEYTPPELQYQKFGGILRTPNHDRFGLAVTIFYLLFMGRHPFAGVFHGRGENPLERAIADFRFAYGRSASTNQMSPPPKSLPPAVLTPDLIDLFERAFSRSSSQPNARPTGGEWMKALSNFKNHLRACAVYAAAHKVPAHLSVCPWCKLVDDGAPDYFVTITFLKTAGGVPASGFMLGAVWSQIEQISPPTQNYRRPALQIGLAILPAPLPRGVPKKVPARVIVPPSSLQKVVGQIALWSAVVSVFIIFGVSLIVGTIGVVVFAISGIAWAYLCDQRRAEEDRRNPGYESARRSRQKERERRQEALDTAQNDLVRVECQWLHAAETLRNEFASKKQHLESLRQQHERLTAAFNVELDGLRHQSMARQREAFLDKHFIADAKIPQIGRSRITVLRSYGIETAADIDEENILAIHGFGPVITQGLLDWRTQVEGHFRFNPAAPLPDRELLSLQMKYRQLQQTLERELQNAPTALRAISSRADQHLAQVLQEVPTVLSRIAQTEADLSIMSD